MTKADVEEALHRLGRAERVEGVTRYFTGRSGYGAGDLFLAVKVPDQRKVAKAFLNLELDEVLQLLRSPVHEHRLTALFIMVLKASKADGEARRQLYDAYMANIRHVDNWDLVDASAEYIVGPLVDEETLDRLSASESIWERRVAALATFHNIKRGDLSRTLRVADRLLLDKHDLVQKGVGWMLREAANRCSKDAVVAWLRDEDRYRRMGRTMLRYTIEKFPEEERQRFLKGTA